MTASLAALLPRPEEGPLSDEAVLDRFVSWASGQGLSLYPAQEEAILALLEDKHLILATPTGSGKSLVATALHFHAMARGRRSFYTCPIKALVNEKFFALCEAFGPERVGMMTGDAGINPKAPILVCTAEVLANLAMRDEAAEIGDVVMDEFHYYADKDRGVAWQVPLLALPSTRFLLMSATLGDMSTVAEALTARTGRPVAEVKSALRPVPLDFEYRETPLHETIRDLLQEGKSPIYLVNFSQRAAAEQAQNLLSVDLCTKEEKEALKEALLAAQARFDTPYGKEMQKLLRHGLGLHHAGLLPKYRLLVEKLSQSGRLKVISGTDTLGVGVNIPIRTVLFTQLCKFDGEKTAVLTVRDFLQIAGRAGRKGFDVQGSVVAQAPEHVIENARLAQRKAQGKKVVMQKPPQKGYAHWDASTFERLRTQPPEPLQSRFAVTHGLLLSCLQAVPAEDKSYGYRRVLGLVERCHERDYVKGKQRVAAAVLMRSLVGAGVVLHRRGGAGKAAELHLAQGLQHDFSLHQTLSLYLLEALPLLEPTSETFPLDVLTLVESILESPMPVLYAQLDQLKTAKVAELKAQGVEYEQRMEELEKLEWPKPNRDFIYGTFDAFSAKHPWVGQQNIRPKSIARDMFERCATFHEYVRDLGLQRTEGVLLRYLTDAYKTLARSVPEGARDEGVEDVLAYLRTMLREVDSSLLDEWERLKGPKDEAPARAAAPTPARPRPVDPAANPKAFAARIRAELHRLLKSLATGQLEEAAQAIYQRAGEWPPARLEQELAPYLAEHGHVDVTPRARRPDLTLLSHEGGRVWTARQRILDPEGHGDWMLDCAVDLTAERPDDAPLIELRRIGT